MGSQLAKEILERYQSGQCTEAEKATVEDWVAFGIFPEHTISEAVLNQQLALLDQSLPIVPKQVKLFPKIAAAALVLIIAGAGLIYLNQNSQTQNQKFNTVQNNQILPGKNAATLTLANGRRIVLSASANGQLANEAGVSIIKAADGKLIYQIKNSAHTGSHKINTLSTARGETYMVILPDQSKVWLNAASSLKYPSSFASALKRHVELSGEAYFEIAKDKAHPFVVTTDKQEIEVLGTHFNVHNYNDEATVNTTLLEGAVKIKGRGQIKMLKPGQQAIVSEHEVEVSPTVSEYAVAWKDGFFMFNNENMESVMNKIARWYKVKLDYENDLLKEIKLTGTISKFENISKVLSMLERTDILQLKIKGDTIYINRKK